MSYEERPFLPYAAKYWPLRHISQEEVIASQSRSDARTLCNVAGEARVWAPKYFEEDYIEWKRWTDLALASYLGLNLTVEDILAEEEIDVNADGGKYSMTPLHAASLKGHKEIVEMLLSKGADVNI